MAAEIHFEQSASPAGAVFDLAMELKVECYAGYRADERPARFSFTGKPGTPSHEVKHVLDQWYGIGYRCFKVQADDGNLYILRHQESEDRWILDSFRSAQGESQPSQRAMP